jgi:hypothetical protein
VIIAFDFENVIGDLRAVGEVGEGVAPLVDERHIQIGEAGEVDVVGVVFEHELGLHEHRGLLLERVIALQDDAQAVEFLADRRLSHKLDRH